MYAQPHMHLRGKDFELRLIYPTGETQTVLKGRMGFRMADGLRIRQTDRDAQGHAHGRDLALRQLARTTDSIRIRRRKSSWGPQNWDEMSNCFIGVVFDCEIKAGACSCARAEPAAARRLRADARSRRPGASRPEPAVDMGAAGQSSGSVMEHDADTHLEQKTS